MKLLMPIRYISGYSIKVTHPDWINFINRHAMKRTLLILILICCVSAGCDMSITTGKYTRHADSVEVGFIDTITMPTSKGQIELRIVTTNGKVTNIQEINPN